MPSEIDNQDHRLTSFLNYELFLKISYLFQLLKIFPKNGIIIGVSMKSQLLSYLSHVAEEKKPRKLQSQGMMFEKALNISNEYWSRIHATKLSYL